MAFQSRMRFQSRQRFQSRMRFQSKLGGRRGGGRSRGGRETDAQRIEREKREAKIKAEKARKARLAQRKKAIEKQRKFFKELKQKKLTTRQRQDAIKAQAQRTRIANLKRLKDEGKKLSPSAKRFLKSREAIRKERITLTEQRPTLLKAKTQRQEAGRKDPLKRQEEERKRQRDIILKKGKEKVSQAVEKAIISAKDPTTKIGKVVDIISLGSITESNLNSKQRNLNKQVDAFNEEFAGRELTEREAKVAGNFKKILDKNQKNIDKSREKFEGSKLKKIGKVIRGLEGMEIKDFGKQINKEQQFLKDLDNKISKSKGLNKQRLLLIKKGKEQTIESLKRGENPYRVVTGDMPITPVGTATSLTKVTKIRFIGKQRVVKGKIVTDIAFVTGKGKRVGIARGVSVQKGKRGESIVFGRAGKRSKKLITRKPKIKRVKPFVAFEDTISKPSQFKIRDAIKLIKNRKKVSVIRSNVQGIAQLGRGVVAQVKGKKFFNTFIKFPSGKIIRRKSKKISLDNFASASSVFTKGDLSRIIGKTITVRGFKAEFIGLIKGQRSLTKINLDKVKKAQYTKALNKVISAVASAEARSQKIKGIGKQSAISSNAITALIAKQTALAKSPTVTAKKTTTPQALQTGRTRADFVKLSTRTKQKTAVKTKSKQRSGQKLAIKTRQKTKQATAQKAKQVPRQATGQAQKLRLKTLQKNIAKQIKKTSSVTFPGITRTIIIPRFAKGKSRRIIVVLSETKKGFDVFARPLKKKGMKRMPKMVKVNKVPLKESDAKDLKKYILDTSLARTGTIKETGKKALHPKTKFPKGYSKKTRSKFRTYRRFKGKKIPLKKGTIIEKGRNLLDTKQEKKGITLRRRIAQLSKPKKKRKISPSQRKELLKRLEKARKAKAINSRRARRVSKKQGLQKRKGRR